jgi:hypothetical protein
VYGDAEDIFVTTNVVAYFVAAVKALDVVGMAEAVNVGDIIRDRCNRRNAIELRNGEDLARTCARSDLCVVEDADLFLRKN